MNYDIVHSTKQKKNYSLPNNVALILRASIPKNFDLIPLMKNDAKSKIINDEMNDFKFYEIPFYERVDSEIFNKTGILDFKSIHKLNELNEKKGIKTRNKFYKKLKLTEFEKNVRNELKFSGSHRFLLREIYDKLDQNIIYKDRQTVPTLQNEEGEKETINNLEIWEKDKSIHLFKSANTTTNSMFITTVANKTQKNQIKNKTTINFFPQNKNNDTKKNPNKNLPLINVKSPKSSSPKSPSKFSFESILKEDESAKLRQIKFAKEEKFKDEKTGKALLKYLKSYESPDVIQNKIREEKESQEEDAKEEKLGLSVADLNKYVKGIFLAKIEGPLLEKALSYKNLSIGALLKINKKIKDCEAFLSTRGHSMITIRKENSYIIAKMKTIKEIINNIKESLKKTKKGKNNEIELLPSVKQKSAYFGKNTLNSQPSSASSKTRSITVEKFMEKAFDDQIKEDELNKMLENYQKFENKLKYNNDILQKMEDENQVERRNYKETQRLYRDFMLRLLLEGKDCRNEGISWIIQELWKIGEIISSQQLPSFIDNKAREFILFKAKKQQEIDELAIILHTYLENFKNNFKDNKIENRIRSIEINKQEKTLDQILVKKFDNDTIINKECANLLMKKCESFKKVFGTRKSMNDIIYESTQLKLREEVYQNRSKAKKTEENNNDKQKEIDVPNSLNFISYIENTKKLNDYKNRNEFFKDSENIEAKIQEKISQITIYERSEISRIIKEFDFQDYGFKYSTDCETVLSALIGSKKAYTELIRTGMLKKI